MSYLNKIRSGTIVLIFSLLLFNNVAAQKTTISRVEPLNWWVGMHNPALQLLVYGPNISIASVDVKYDGVELQKTIKVQNPNYLFLDLKIAPDTKPGKMTINFKAGKQVISYQYQLLVRETGSAQRECFNSSDAIYLVMPDRFANGNTQNDNQPGMVQLADRNAPFGRHGGDLKGVSDHLDYIKDLGFTALWLNPVQENNQPEASYHGYAITDFYKIDPRFGTNEEYRELVKSCREKGIKVIMDMVFNHCGSKHWWMNDLPTNDWINQFPQYTQSNFRLSTVSDPHGSTTDRNLNFRGWVDTAMPDMNLQNDLMNNYLIQNSIWWVEYAGLQGIRMDTYPYPDKEGMRKWNLRVREEYSNFNIVGETWISSTAKLSYWQKDAPNKDGFNSELPSLMDFPLMEALRRAFNEKDSWDDGLLRLYNVLADDFLYPNPDNLVVFPENHDIGRLIHFYNNDVRKYKMSMAFIATVRGIPQLYYGSEILMDGDGFVSHPQIREDFPGGWPTDSISAFTAAGRTPQQNDAFNYLSKLLNYRKNAEVLHNGKLIHFVPQNEIYVYFRILGDKAVMVILNNAEEGVKTLQSQRYNEILKDYSKGVNIITGATLQTVDGLQLAAKSATVIELSK